MRIAFTDELTCLAAKDERIVMLSGDIGNRLFDQYKALAPNRFYNCGVAEANMISVAAGLAMSGLKPIVYTIAPFITTRCLEQIRVDLCYHNLPVIITGVGAGLAYTNNGSTHEACEDISFLRSIPGMTVVCPGDSVEVRLALREALKLQTPVYIRLGKKNEPVVHQTKPDFTIGKGIVLRNGNDVCLISTGNMLPVAMETADLLASEDIATYVISMHTVKPLDERLLSKSFDMCSLVATIEEHSRIGGLGSAVAEWMTNGDAMPRARLLRIGTPDKFLHESGNQQYKRKLFGLTPGAIAKKVYHSYIQQSRKNTLTDSLTLSKGLV